MSATISLKPVSSSTAHSRSISALKFSSDGKYFASASKTGADCTVKVFKSDDMGMAAHTFSNGHQLGISDVVWSPDGNYLASASDDKTIAIWSLNSGGSEPIRKLQGHTSYVYCMAFSPNGALLASGGFDDSLRLWDVRHGKVFREIAAHGDPVTSVSFSDDGTVLLTSSFDGLMRLWDVESGHCLKTIVDNDNPAVSSAVFTAQSKYILSSTLDSRIRLWSPKTGKCLRTLNSPDAGYRAQKYSCGVKLVSFQETKSVLVLAGSEDGALYLWNLDTKELLGRWQVLQDKSPILALDVSPDQKSVLCAGLEPHNEIHCFTLYSFPS